MTIADRKQLRDETIDDTINALYFKENDNPGRGSKMSWEKNVRKVVPYVAGEQPKEEKVIKLNTNECPYPPAPGVQKLLREFPIDRLRLYPDTNATKLADALAKYYGIRPEEIFIGVGSDDVLGMSFLTFFHGDKPILFPDITYSFYDVWADLFGIPYKTCALDENFRIKREDYFQNNGGIILPNPNAPTAILEDTGVLEEIVAANPDSIVIIDEAYIDFGGKSMLPLIHKYDNLMVVQTFSKSRAMAGVRIGFAMANEKIIKYLKDVKESYNSYTMNMVSIEAGTAAVKDKAYFEDTINKVIKTREWTKDQLSQLGFRFTDSKSNFLFATHEHVPAKEIFEALKQRHIYVRYWNKPRIDNYLRITIGTDEEMMQLCNALREIILK